MRGTPLPKRPFQSGRWGWPASRRPKPGPTPATPGPALHRRELPPQGCLSPGNPQPASSPKASCSTWFPLGGLVENSLAFVFLAPLLTFVQTELEVSRVSGSCRRGDGRRVTRGTPLSSLTRRGTSLTRRPGRRVRRARSACYRSHPWPGSPPRGPPRFPPGWP